MNKKQTRPKILIAEDNHINGLLARRMLRKLGYDADIAANGVEAIEAVKLGDYSIVLMDIQMPEMDGIEATQWILNHKKPAPTIIAMTANTLAADQLAYQLAGMVDLIGKPLAIEEIEAVVSRWEKPKQD